VGPDFLTGTFLLSAKAEVLVATNKDVCCAPGKTMRPIRKTYLVVRSLFVWLISALHFFTVCTALVILGIFVNPRWNDWPQRFFFRNILRFAGVRFERKFSPGFNPEKTSIFISNHINFFDAFVIYSAIPQFVRGLELDTHFKIPAYGWMMKRFGNIPVSRGGGLAQFKKTLGHVRTHIQSGISVIVFSEGTRTLTGMVGPFEKGAFVMARQIGCPIVPMSICGSYQFSRKGDWMLYPSKITVHLHDTIETKGISKDGLDELIERVHGIIAGPVAEDLAAHPPEC
jgi:1-acyl-sn-glycerol-3-phosphate acyltransferase